MANKTLSISIKLCLLVLLFIVVAREGGAQGEAELRKNIEQKNSQIETLNREIKELEGQINEVNKESRNLENTIKSLDISRQKLLKELKVTEEKISNANLTIKKLGSEIGRSQESIETKVEVIGDSLRAIQQKDDITIVEAALTYKNLGALWDDLESIERFQIAVRENVKRLQEEKRILEDRQEMTRTERVTLENLTEELGDRKKIVEINKQEKDSLLLETKSKESNFRKILSEKEKLSEAFRKELTEYESQLKLIIDPGSYPSPGKGILFWPLDNVHITQYFGNTEFSKTAAYSGKGHNGIDLRAARGTAVKAAASGLVESVGDTGQVRGCYSYGKWVLLRHDNGLSTLYAHLDLIKVSDGSRVTVGDIIAYSGNTGYSTGPHLHFGVYASQGTRVVRFTQGQSINCTGALVPVADTRAYLNPLLYL